MGFNKTTDRQVKINREITKPEVRVIFEDGTSQVMKTFDAQKLAFEQGIDLIEISPTANPPVCKIMEYSKYVYQLNKKKKEQKAPRMKEVKFTSTISENDISYRVKNMKEFLSSGHKVKVTLVYKGRTITHADIGENKLKEILEQVKEFGTPQGEPKLEGKYLTVYLNPIKK